MEIKQPAHARLQILIREWMRDEVPEVRALFVDHETHTGVVVGGERGCSMTADLVAMHAADAAYTAVSQAAHVISLVNCDDLY